MRRLVHHLLLCGALALPGWAFATASNPGVTQNEWRLLPRACWYVEGAPGLAADPVTVQRLRANDITWIHMHHYCWAIVQTHRTYQTGTTPREGAALLDAAIQNLDYAIERSRPGFELRPDMLLRKSRLLMRRGRLLQAADTAALLIAENPGFADGYIVLAEIQLKAGRKADARATLEKGDQMVEDQERYRAMKAQLDLR